MNTGKQSSNDCMKTPVTENAYIKLENSRPQIKKKTDEKENKIRINKMTQSIIREFPKITNTVMKDREPFKDFQNHKNNLMQIKLTNYAIEGLPNQISARKIFILLSQSFSTCFHTRNTYMHVHTHIHTYTRT